MRCIEFWCPEEGFDALPRTSVRVQSLQQQHVSNPQARRKCLVLVHPAVPQSKDPGARITGRGYCA